jgi:hypothetical protein
MPPFVSYPVERQYERLRIALAVADMSVDNEEVTAWYNQLCHRRRYLQDHREQVELLIVLLGRVAENPTDVNLDLARKPVWDLCRDLDIPLPLLRVGASRRVSAWLAECAARIIPVAERARYREEFEAELIGIGRGWRQFGHGVRVLGRAVPLRWELRRPG